MKKILILANNSVGLYNFRFELIEELIKQGYEVYVSLPEATDDEKVKLLMMAGAKHIQIYINRRGSNLLEELKLIKEYKRIVKEINPDIVLTYTIKPNIYGTYAASIKKKPVLINVTGLGTSFTSSKFKQVVFQLYKYACSKATVVFFQNESNRAFFINNKIVDLNKTILLPGSGVNTSKFKPLEKMDGRRVIKFLFIGRVMREKGINEYLEVANIITSKYENVEFYVLGPFEEQEYEIIFQNNLNDRIRYLGVSSDVREEIREADCIVNPSYHEGMSNVLLEAASMGKPLIASNISGCKEIISEGENGFLFDVQSVSSLQEKIIRFINLDEKSKAYMGEQSRRKVICDFDRNKVLKEYLSIIEKLI